MTFFDPRNIERDPVIEVVEEGTYIVQIDKAVKKEDHSGLKLKVVFKINSPAIWQGKLLMDNFNLGHSNPDTERIARQQFTRLLDCIEMGQDVVKSEHDIEKKIVKVEVSVGPHYKDPTKSQNKITKYLIASPIEVIKQAEPEDVPF